LQNVFLSHDVDWRRQGAPIGHIIARKERFEKDILEDLAEDNPYYNLPEYINIEDKYNVKSTFFFRTTYENGNFEDYEDDITTLISGGWEVGLHSDPSSVDDIMKIYREKRKLEMLTKTSIKGNRVHYLNFNDKLPMKLQKLGFEYDSSLSISKDKIGKQAIRHRIYDEVIEFPITLMDAYLFTYMHLTEEKILCAFKKTLNLCRNEVDHINIITIIWHDNVLRMKGGRMYDKILEYLVSQDDVSIKKGIDLANMIKNYQIAQ
jgi:peptidoglycan/xylan/chitin deacetylase (PgdA/CDA1 family)